MVVVAVAVVVVVVVVLRGRQYWPRAACRWCLPQALLAVPHWLVPLPVVPVAPHCQWCHWQWHRQPPRRTSTSVGRFNNAPLALAVTVES